MYIPISQINEILLKNNIHITGAFHIGAHDCEELPFYNKLNLLNEDIIWIDAINRKVIEATQKGIPNVYNAVITDKDDENIILNISNNVQSSSVLEFGTHSVEHPEVVYIDKLELKSITVDSFFTRNNIDGSKYNFWNFDIQGAELMALKGSIKHIQYAKVIYLEVNERELYKNCGLIQDIDLFLSKYKFKRVITHMTPWGWGDALYISDNIRCFTKDDIITTDKYLYAFNDIYYKTDVIYNNAPIHWRNKVHHPPRKNMDIIITGHSDYGINDTCVDLYTPKIWYTVNKQTTRSNVYSLPLGITNNTDTSLIQSIYGDLDCMITVMNENNYKIKNLVYMNFNISTYPKERQIVYNLFCDKQWVTSGETINTLEGRKNYLRDIKKHDFVLCPRGNGIDTHRLWESLYMGSIPIVKRDISFKDFEDLPICFVDYWSDINEEFLKAEKHRIKNTTYNLEKLKIGYWIDKIKSSINSKDINNSINNSIINSINNSINNGMKLTTVLASTNNNSSYYRFIPSQILFWKHFNIKFIAVFVGESIPDELEEYKENIILWDKPTNYILNTAYIAQNIRIYYPALLNLPDNEMVMITDMDMLPTNNKFYKSGLEIFTKKDFVYYRHIDGKQIYMCYNAAHPSVWSEVFNIYLEKDIEHELINNYNNHYDGIPGSTGWYSDQELMYNKLIKYPFLKVLNRPLKRLEMHMYKKHLENGDKEFISLYDDAHFHRNYDSNKNYILNAKTQLLSTIHTSNVIPDNILNAVIITGQIRTFEQILKSLVTNIILPNNAIVFICCETDSKEELYKILYTYPEIKIG